MFMQELTLICTYVTLVLSVCMYVLTGTSRNWKNSNISLYSLSTDKNESGVSEYLV